MTKYGPNLLNLQSFHAFELFLNKISGLRWFITGMFLGNKACFFPSPAEGHVASIQAFVLLFLLQGSQLAVSGVDHILALTSCQMGS